MGDDWYVDVTSSSSCFQVLKVTDDGFDVTVLSTAMGLLDLNTVPSLELIVLSWIDNAEQKLFGLSPFQGLVLTSNFELLKALIHDSYSYFRSLLDRRRERKVLQPDSWRSSSTSWLRCSQHVAAGGRCSAFRSSDPRLRVSTT